MKNWMKINTRHFKLLLIWVKDFAVLINHLFIYLAIFCARFYIYIYIYIYISLISHECYHIVSALRAVVMVRYPRRRSHGPHSTFTKLCCLYVCITQTSWDEHTNSTVWTVVYSILALGSKLADLYCYWHSLIILVPLLALIAIKGTGGLHGNPAHRSIHPAHFLCTQNLCRIEQQSHSHHRCVSQRSRANVISIDLYPVSMTQKPKIMQIRHKFSVLIELHSPYCTTDGFLKYVILVQRCVILTCLKANHSI